MDELLGTHPTGGERYMNIKKMLRIRKRFDKPQEYYIQQKVFPCGFQQQVENDDQLECFTVNVTIAGQNSHMVVDVMAQILKKYDIASKKR